VLALLALACAEGSAWPGENLLRNPGFEGGREGWSIRDQSLHWGDFRVVDAPVRSGRGAVHLRLHHGATLPPRPVKVYGVVQELEPGRVPETVGGYYRVERWDRVPADATDLYLQVVVIAWLPETEPLANLQIRYYLTGLDEPPFRLGNARVVFVERGAPRLGEWRRFELPLRDDFERLWEHVPARAERFSVLFEARWDNMPWGHAVYADVYYDDLFVGDPPVGD
jgi:hypothetical protein